MRGEPFQHIEYSSPAVQTAHEKLRDGIVYARNTHFPSDGGGVYEFPSELYIYN